ncbi:UNVERIFIED_CONTAM: hypothetical protein K2H54_052457 [Gekko kuhli]
MAGEETEEVPVTSEEVVIPKTMVMITIMAGESRPRGLGTQSWFYISSWTEESWAITPDLQMVFYGRQYGSTYPEEYPRDYGRLPVIEVTLPPQGGRMIEGCSSEVPSKGRGARPK